MNEIYSLSKIWPHFQNKPSTGYDANERTCKEKAMQKELSKFCRDDAGAVTVDWVVLTAAIVGLGIVVVIPIGYSAGNSASVVSNSIKSANVGYQSQATP